MIFSSYEFIFAFLPMALGSYLVLAKFGLFRLAIASTIIFSILFYTWWNPPYIFLIFALIIVNFALGVALTSATSYRRAILTLGIAINLGTLGYFKYTNFLIGNLNAAAGTSIAFRDIVLPLAISFFTFQKIAFLVDVYRRVVTRISFPDYCLFVVFFPQLIAGPIVHYRDLQPQFDLIQTRGPDIASIIPGMAFFIIGLFKKVVIADGVAHYATPIFDSAANGMTIGTTDAWIAALAYTFQLYFDFSGYTDMAIGLALMFGINLPFNFNSPYKATSIIEFWRRWHITLSMFLRDYLYIPLGGNRHGEPRRLVNLMATMLLGGLWHGAGWTFVVWGGMHGLYLVINHLWRSHSGVARWFEARGLRPIYVLASTMTTFLAVVVAWVFFRATSFSAAIAILSGMTGAGGQTMVAPGDIDKILILALLLGIAFTAPNSQEIVFGRVLSRYSTIAFPALGAAAFAALMLLGAPSEFLYFRF